MNVDRLTGWGIDACLTTHVPDDEFPAFLALVSSSGVRVLRERTVPGPGADSSVIRERLRAEKQAGFSTVVFANVHGSARVQQVGNALPENLMEVFAGGEWLAREYAGLVDAWEMVGEPDVGYCTDLPDRVAAFQKALYLGLRSGGHAVGGQPPVIVMGALALPPGPWLERAKRNGLLDYTDAYNFHFYGWADDFRGVIAAHERQAVRSEKLAGIGESRLPLWVTECGINAVPRNDFANVERRKWQDRFVTSTSQQALAVPSVAVFMPFILVHDGDPHALVASASQPYPAWNSYRKLSRAQPWPERPVSNVPSNPNPIVLQWIPNNATTYAHKVSGTYRFRPLESVGGSSPSTYADIRGEIRVYNFGSISTHGRIGLAGLSRIQAAMTNEKITVGAGDWVSIPVTLQARATGYIREPARIEFSGDDGVSSVIEFGVETPPQERDFVSTETQIFRARTGNLWHRFGPLDEMTSSDGPWQGVNGISVAVPSPVPVAAKPEHVPALSQSTNACQLEIRLNTTERDPVKAKLAVAGIAGLSPNTFIRIQLDRPMSAEFAMCVDLVDRGGQRFTIWENFGVSYFEPKAREVWLSLRDFHPYFWGRCTTSGLDVDAIDEIQLRCYIVKSDTPQRVALSFMRPR